MITLFGLTKVFMKPDYHKITIVSLLIIFFTLLLSFFDDSHFGGLEIHHELLNDIHNKVHKVEKKNKKKHNFQIFKKIFNRFYYITVCTTTVGFGDVYPKSFQTKLITIIYILILFYICFFDNS